MGSMGGERQKHDAPERSGALAELTHKLEEAERAIAIRDQLLSIVAHDLRNPLNAISVGTDLLSMPSSGLNDGPRKVVGRIRHAVDRMDRLLRDLLDAATIERGKLEIAPEPIALERLLDELETALAPEAANRSVALDLRSPPGVVTADRDRILQVLEILVGQALKFAPKDGRVKLRVEPRDDRIRFVVSDTGPAIPEEELSGIFDRVGSAAGPSRRPGIGLGLSLAKGIVETHRGTIWAESGSDQGATFTFELPIEPGSYDRRT